LLQEVPWRSDDMRTVREALKGLELTHMHYSGDEPKRYGNVIASRWPIAKGDLRPTTGVDSRAYIEGGGNTRTWTCGFSSLPKPLP